MPTNSYHSRINDHALSFGMERYSTGQKDTDDYLWKLVVSEHCGSRKLQELEVSVQDLMCLRNFCNRAIETLKTDGDRTAPTTQGESQ